MADRQVPLMLSVPPECRDKLRKIAAERMLQNPSKVVGTATIAREMLMEALEAVERMETNLSQNA